MSITNYKGVIKNIDIPNTNNQSISKIVTGVHYVDNTRKVLDVSDGLNEEESLRAIAVVDQEGRVVGIIKRQTFFALLSRPFARDIMKNKEVGELAEPVQTFKRDANIFHIADKLKDQLQEPENRYFALVDEAHKFGGIFSTRDMLIYLSNITQNDIDLARKMQTRMVKERDLIVGQTFEFSAVTNAAQGVGGDFYAVKEYLPGKWFFMLGDVSGKGMAASIITSVIMGMSNLYDFSQGFSNFIKNLNNFIFNTFETEKFVTGVFLDYHEATRTIKVCDMGHSHLFVHRGDKLTPIRGKKRNFPVGVLPDVEPNILKFKPREEDIILLLTDGILEQENTRNEIYPFESITSIIRESCNEGVEVICEQMQKDFNYFRGDAHLSDDMTFALIKIMDQHVVL